MREHLLAAWRTVAPERDDPHGPLPPLLVLLTVVTGLVDAFSYLSLGRVFVANMTGNVVFLAFSLGGAAGFVWWASILAILTFSLGAFVGGRIRAAHGHHRGLHLRTAAIVQLVLLAAAFVTAVVAEAPYDDGELAALIVLLGVGMGVQNATSRALAVPDLTTTVLTLTITGISADSSAAGGGSSKMGRRLVSIASMFVGALIGAPLVLAGQGEWVLLIASVLLGVITTAAARAAHSTEPWTAQK